MPRAVFPGDAPPQPSPRFVLPAIILLIASILAMTFVFASHRKSELVKNEIAALHWMDKLVAAQHERLKQTGQYAPDIRKLGGAYDGFNAYGEQPPTAVHGFHLNMDLADSVDKSADGKPKPRFLLMAIPVKYGFTARRSFFYDSEQRAFFSHDFGVERSHKLNSTFSIVIPPTAFKLPGPLPPLE